MAAKCASPFSSAAVRVDGIGDEARDDAIQVGLPLLPVVRIAIQADVLALLPLGEHERARNRWACWRWGAIAGRPRRRCAWAGSASRSRRRPSSCRAPARRASGSPCGRPACPPRSPRAKVLGPRGWVTLATFMMENCTSAEVSGLPSWNFTPLRSLKVMVRPSGGHGPGLGQSRLGLELGVVLQQAVVDLGRHHADGAGGGHVRREGRGLGLHQHDQGAALLLCHGRMCRR